nr:putative ribonuclease H-like domain-containing protein [Tanacetum cinerariifolium]
MGHFSRECRGPRNQDSRNKYQDSSRRTVHVEEPPPKAMVSIDGVSFDCSYMAKDKVPTNMALMAFLDSEATLDESMLWHRRLGHVNFKNINKLVENDQTCVACLKGKQHKASCKSKIQNSISQPLFMPHMDLFDPTFVSGLMHKKYRLVISDDYSRYTWVFFLATKDETTSILKKFITKIENLVDKKVKLVRCDNRTEFKNSVMNDFFAMKGIRREFSVARTPQQNGVAKRRNKILIEAARTMLPDSKLPTTFGLKQLILLAIKAFMVYNIRTRRVEENLNIEFLENKPIVTGAGPEWLFDIDMPTKLMKYVLVIAGTNSNIFCSSTKKELCTEFERLMKDKFQMSSIGELTFFLGLQVKKKEDEIFISHDKYVAEVLRKFSFSDVKSANTPVDIKKTLVKDADGDDVDVHLYRSMIGSLMYLTASRQTLCMQYVYVPYFKSHLRDSLFELVVYTDSDYARASLDMKSTTGGFQFLGSR